MLMLGERKGHNNNNNNNIIINMIVDGKQIVHLLDMIVLWVSVATTLSVLFIFPYQNQNQNQNTTFLFQNSCSLFHAFVLSLNFSLFGCITTIVLRHTHPESAAHFFLLSLASTAAGILILLLLLLSAFK